MPGRRKSLSPLPRQRAMLVSPLSCGVRRVAVFNRGGVQWGSGRRAPRRAGGGWRGAATVCGTPCPAWGAGRSGEEKLGRQL